MTADPQDRPRLVVVLPMARRSLGIRDYTQRLAAALRESRRVDLREGPWWGAPAADVLDVQLGNSSRELIVPLLARRRAARVFVTLHDVLALDPRARLAWQRVLRRVLRRRVDHVIVHSVAAQLLAVDSLGVTPDAVSIVAHGVTLHAVDRDAVRAAYGLPCDRPIIAVGGVLKLNKGVLEVIEATKSLASEPVVLLAGEVADPAIAAALRRASPQRLRHVRGLNDAALAELLGAADLVVAVRRTDVGAASGVAALARGAGVPVIEGPAEVVSLTRALAGALASAEHLAGLRAQARAAAQAVTWAAVADLRVALYLRVLGEQGARR